MSSDDDCARPAGARSSRPPAGLAAAAQAALIAATALLGWLVMQATHEAGHVLHAALSGGVVERVVLHPLTFSRTLLAANPAPLFVAWGGAAWGCAMPLLAVGAARVTAPRVVPYARAVAGVCLLANGVYLGAGAFVGAGDAGDLLAAGASRWQLVAFGVIASAGGLAAWNGNGEAFTRERVDRRALAWVVGLVAVVIALELALSPAG